MIANKVAQEKITTLKLQSFKIIPWNQRYPLFKKFKFYSKCIPNEKK